MIGIGQIETRALNKDQLINLIEKEFWMAEGDIAVITTTRSRTMSGNKIATQTLTLGKQVNPDNAYIYERNGKK